MNAERHQRLLEAFTRLCDLPADERAAALEAFGGDESFRRELETLLANHDQPIDALAEQNCSGNGARLLALGLGASDELRGPDERPAHDTERPQHIGRYRIIRTLGEGGMGIVYEAEQEDPRRRVAVKMLRPGLVTRTLLNRFRNEAQILGRLHHPGIARVVEAGIADPDEGGQPYLVMELIDGRPLLDFATTHDLDVRARLALVTRICDALQHAHEHGVVHRDLKHANILVEPTGQPRILDFGVARMADADVQAVTLQTEAGQLIGTLQYMSPEQAAGDASQLDGRSDVYSVGVIMYELLAGQLPYDLNEKLIPDLARIIRDVEPRRIGSVDRGLRGDIEVIVAKALAKEPGRRYGSAAELAADIRRHLDDRPITARPASTIYRVHKFVKRRKGLVASSILAVANAITLTAASLSASSSADSRGVGVIAETATSSTMRGIRSADDWLAACPEAVACAFDEFYPGVDRRKVACLLDTSADQPVTLALDGGEVTVSAFDRAGSPVCAIRDASTVTRVSDAVILPGGMVVLEFEPPITAFYSMFGSVAPGATVTAILFARETLVDVVTSMPSVHKSHAQGHGFVADTLIDRIELTSTDESGNVLVGAYRAMLDGEPPLGMVSIPGYGGPVGDDVFLDFACVFAADAMEYEAPGHEPQADRSYSVSTTGRRPTPG